GDLTVTAEPGPGYVLGDEPSLTVTVVAAVDVVVDCTLDLGADGDFADDQTIRVRQRPEPLGLLGRGDGVRVSAGSVGHPAGPPEHSVFGDVTGPIEGLRAVVAGDLPPGLTYAVDEFGGAATAPGEYRFDVRICLDDALTGVPIDGT